MTILSPRSTLGTTAFILPSDLNDDWTYMAGSGHYGTADLKAALGIDELGCGCEEADDNLKAAIQRAEDAEAFGAAAVKRAEEAEAAVDRVRAVLDQKILVVPPGTSTIHELYAQLREALDPKPAFTLPTEAPATIECQHKDDGRTYRLDLWVDGDGGVLWLGPGCAPLGAGQVMADFTDHRLLGADQ